MTGCRATIVEMRSIVVCVLAALALATAALATPAERTHQNHADVETLMAKPFCNPAHCTMMCSRRGLQGVCRNTECHCVLPPKPSRPQAMQISQAEVTESETCVPRICVQHCVITVGKMGWCTKEKKCMCYP